MSLNYKNMIFSNKRDIQEKLKIKLVTILIFTFIINILIKSTNSQNNCNLKIADNMISSFSGNDIIYNFGKLDEFKFGKNALFPYTVPFAKEIDYFYATEIHLA